MRVTSIGSDIAQIRDLARTRAPGAQQPAKTAAATGVGNTIDEKIRRMEIAPLISEHMVRIYHEQLEATGSREKAAEAVRNSDVFRSFLNRQAFDPVTTSMAASALIDRVIPS